MNNECMYENVANEVYLNINVYTYQFVYIYSEYFENSDITALCESQSFRQRAKS